MTDKHSWRSLFRVSGARHRDGTLESRSLPTTDFDESAAYQPSKAEIGRHADEEKMPRWLRRVLESGDEVVTKEVVDTDGVKRLLELRAVETPGVVEALAHFSKADSHTARASFCDPRVHHVAKLRREGSFCGYRNVQMLLSYICNAKIVGHEQFTNHPLPSIFQLQDLIEDAWDRGYNTSSRDEIGSIRMTRKFIGTSEVEALLSSLRIPLVRKGFASIGTTSAIQSLIGYVSEYFDLQRPGPVGEQVIITRKPPIFLQRPGHSMTVVGIHRDTSGQDTLLIFDPKFRVPKMLGKSAVAVHDSLSPKPHISWLKQYRYGSPELGSYDVFEIIHLDDHVIVAD